MTTGRQTEGVIGSYQMTTELKVTDRQKSLHRPPNRAEVLKDKVITEAHLHTQSQCTIEPAAPHSCKAQCKP